MKNLFFLLTVLLFGISANAQVLTFEQALQLAKEHNIGLKKAQNNVESAQWDVVGNKKLFLPNAVFTSNYNFQSGKNLLNIATPTVTNSTYSNLNLQGTSNYVLADGSARKYQLSASQKILEAQNSQLKFTRQQLYSDLSLAFLQLSLDKKLIEIATQNWQLSLQRDSILMDLVKAGLRLPSDLYQQEAQARSDEQQVIATKNQLQKDKIVLTRRLNLPVNTYDFAEIPEMPLENFSQDLVLQAIEKRYDIQSLDRQKEATALRTKQIEAALKPQIVASGGLFTNDKYLFAQKVNGVDALANYTQHNAIYQLANQINIFAGVGLVWNVFDRNQTKVAATKNRLLETNQQLDIKDRQDQIRADINQALADFETAKQQVITSNAQISAAQAAFDLQQGRFHEGLATIIDLFAAQNALINAKVNMVRSQIQVRYQQQLLKFYAGDVNEDF